MRRKPKSNANIMRWKMYFLLFYRTFEYEYVTYQITTDKEIMKFIVTENKHSWTTSSF